MSASAASEQPSVSLRVRAKVGRRRASGGPGRGCGIVGAGQARSESRGGGGRIQMVLSSDGTQMVPCVAWMLVRTRPPSSSSAPASRLEGAGGRGGEGGAAILARG